MGAEAVLGNSRPRLTPLVAALAAAIAVLLIAPLFFSWANLVNLLRQVAINGVIASGMTVVIIAGGFDLSVGAIAALAGVLAVNCARAGLFAGIMLPILAGATVGALNGLLVSRAAINPLIATLGMRYAVYAAVNLFTAGFIQVTARPDFVTLGRGSAAGVPSTAIVFLAAALLVHVLLRYTSAGSAIYAVGSNEGAAFFSGISTARVRTATYALSGACAALAGVVLASRSSAAAPDGGEGFELEAIAAVVVGGVSIFGGSGSILHTLMGVFLLGIVNNVLVLAKQPYEMHRIATGVILENRKTVVGRAVPPPAKPGSSRYC